MSLADIVKHFRGEFLNGSRTEALIPGPNHSAHDRSVSLKVDDRARLIVNSWGRSDWTEAKDMIREAGFIGFDGRLSDAPPSGGERRSFVALVSDPVKRETALRIWDSAQRRTRGTPVEIHAARRRILRPLPGGEVLRFHRGVPLDTYRWRGPRIPACVAAIRDRDGGLTGVEITYLTADGRRATMRTPRKTIGSRPPGSCVPLDAPAAAMLVAEGVWTALSASEFFGLPAEAALSANNMKTWRPKPGVSRVLAACDYNLAGFGVGRVLLERLRSAGVAAEAAFPPMSVDDFNTMAHFVEPNDQHAFRL